MIRLENEYLRAEISLHGAELRSLVRRDTGESYLWYADPKFWGRTSPVLFPIVGGLKDKKYRVDGKEYSMSQHGFARDMDFAAEDGGVCREETAAAAWFVLEENGETLAKYPFRFRLRIGYRLEGKSVHVMWRVKNTDRKPLYFSIGAHPAFLCPLREGEDQRSCRIVFYKENGEFCPVVVSRMIGKDGLAADETTVYSLTEGGLAFDRHLFDNDALVLENHQAQQIGLTDGTGREFIRVKFTAPLVGVWAPAGGEAPFVCIEPWYGRCDANWFHGELKDREWGNTLEAGDEFSAEYEIMAG